MRIVSNSFTTILFVVAFIIGIDSCANRGLGPTGGPKDLTPPKVLKVNPPDKTTNFDGKRIEVLFNKIVQLDDPLDKIVVSPPQTQMPAAVSTGRRVVVTFNDSLQKNTTYTIDFNGAIKDYREGNILRNFSTSFSTGSTIDSMQVSGIVLDAQTLNPVQGVLTGVYANLSDSAFTHFPMLRIGKTEKDGHFSIMGMKPGSYRVYALKDMDGDYKFSQPAEGIAFDEKVIHTSSKMDIRNDTIRKDSVTIDTIMHVSYVHYMPDTLTLLYFKENFSRQRLFKSERPEADKLVLYFTAPTDTLPHLNPLGFRWKSAPLIQKSVTTDTLTYWITDTLAAKADTLHFVLHYAKSDSIGKLEPATDTLQLHWHGFGLEKKQKSKKEKNKAPVIKIATFDTNITQVMDMDEPIRIDFQIPVMTVDTGKIHLYQKIDSLWKPVRFAFHKDDDVGMHFSITYDYQPDESYKLLIDSAALRDFHGLWTTKYMKAYKIRALEEYSSLIIHLTHPLQHVVYELLDGNDKVLRTLKASPDNNTTFKYVMPGTYYLRMFIDSNDNGKWDTGDFARKIEPERVYYFPGKIVLRVNWDIEQDWDPTALPLNKQKPKELIKEDKSSTSPQSGGM
ncbi:Ig-like domain-containing domain [Microbacter margulisiae]|uniref:Uncharacterized protein (DUF2141 family) n=1 Tax=Microbacter margulisiae TaxID=1350067 RepID=A0A7W5H1F7_9PORP|nr:Ig-like domain-containing domain [Microbacter margulisiae]MBB3186574.1 uncharacterized protein (DUF2141 family) [Microbacter margulisiae]